MSNRSVFFYPNRENLVGVEELLPALKLQWHLSSTGENDQYSLYISEKNSSESYHMAVHALKEAKVPFFTETQRHCIMIPTHTLESRLALANRHLDIILAICREKKILFEQQYLSYQQMLNNVFLTPRLWEKTFSFSSQNLPRIGLKLSITDNIPKIRQTLLAFFRSITTENNIDIKPTHCGLFDIVPLSPDQSEKMNTLLKELAREEKNDNISTHSAHYFPQPRYIENSESHRENSSFPSFLTFIGNNWTSIFSDRRSHAPIVSSPEKPFYSWLDGVISTQTNAVFSIQTSYTQQQPEKYIFLDLDLFPDIEKNSPLHQKIQHFLSAPKMGDGTNCLKRLSGETRWCTHQINEKTYSVNLQYEIKIPSSPARLFCYEVPGDLQNQRHPLIITALYDSQGLHDGHRLSKQKIHAWRYHENGKISLIAHVEEEIFTPSPLN